MNSTPTIKKPRELKQKAQTPIGQAGRVNMNTEVISERLEAHLNCPTLQPNLMHSLHHEDPSRLWE